MFDDYLCVCETVVSLGHKVLTHGTMEDQGSTLYHHAIYTLFVIIHNHKYKYITIMYKKLENLNFLHSLDLQQFPFFKGSRLHVCSLST